jgi:hypothetical protein
MTISVAGFFSGILSGAKAVWNDIQSEIETVYTSDVKPELAAAESEAKQIASNALALADTAAGPILATAATGIEAAVDGLLATVPAGSLADPFADATIAQGFAILKGILDHGYAKLAAQLPPPQVTMKPIP